LGSKGLSSADPKAGGPHDLDRFCVELTVTVNATAGDAALLAGVN
jgi:delta 1-pyrroline-5-carboxylate dehydrogenase